METSDPSAHADTSSHPRAGVLRVLPSSALTDDPDAALVAAAQRGDRAAMHLLLAPWNDSIFGFLLATLRHRADAEDAAQETFIRAVKGLPGYEHRGEFRVWLFRIARNQAALTAARRQRVAMRETSVEMEELEALAADDSASADLAAADRATELRAAVAALPMVEREVVNLRLDHDMKFTDIAQRTGAPLNTVLGRMHNAIRRLRQTITQASS